jgi:hypothetical protein
MSRNKSPPSLNGCADFSKQLGSKFTINCMFTPQELFDKLLDLMSDSKKILVVLCAAIGLQRRAISVED